MKKLTGKERLLILRNEILISEKLIDDIVVPNMQKALSLYTGSYQPPYDVDIVLNEIYPIVQYELPAIFFKSPRAFLKPRNKNYIVKKKNIYTGEREEVFIDGAKSAKTQEHILNYSIERMKYKDQVRKTLLDALLFKYGALWHGYKGNFGMTEESSIYIEDEKVFVSRLSPRKIIFDPKVTLANIDEAEWVGRIIDIPLRDLVEDDELNITDEIKAYDGFGQVLASDNPLISKGGADKYNVFSRARTLLDYTDKEFRSKAKFVKLYEVFRKPTRAERRKGEKGEILLLADGQEEPLRKSQWPYATKEWPLKILMFNDVPDDLFGMSDLEVYSGIADHKNLVINLQIRNAEANSKVMTMFDKSGLEEEEIEKIINGEQNVIGVDGPVSGKIASATPGGAASSELYLLDGRIQQNLDEKSGVNDLKKGSLRSGEESATSVRIRNAGSSSRPAYRQDIMADFIKDSFKFINDLNQQFMPVKEAVRIMGSLDIEWSDIPSKDDIQADVDVEIDVISMLPESPEREIQQNQQILDLMVNALTVPQIGMKLAQEGKTFNLSPIIDQLLYRLKIRDPEAFRNLRPEESQGFAPVAELRAAEANLQAIISGQQLPSPPDKGQNHQTRLGVYVAQKQILALQGQMSEVLDRLIQIQMQIAEEETQEQAPRSNTQLKKPSMEVI